jgi:hypothetical protein
MNMMAKIADQSELSRQARIARELGSPFVAAVLEAGNRQLGQAPRTALAMRFNGALHALARRGMPPALKSLYRREHEDYDGAIGAALAAEDDFIAEWMRDPPQTNEVGRAAAIGAALMVARRKFGLPFELFELGSSCGLNLNLARYAYDLGGISAGAPDSPVRIAPEWRGLRPASAPIEVVAARGVDLKPLDAGDEKTRERLLSFVWADQPKRARRLQYALSLARRFPPRIDRADAASWLAERLDSPQQAGLCRVVFHSMVLQYLTGEDRMRVMEAIARAGARATADRPMAWVGFEWTPERSEVRLSLTCWPSGETRILAICHPYGDWIDWRG